MESPLLCVSARALGRVRSLNLSSHYVWKPQPKEIELLGIMRDFRDSHTTELHMSADYNANERFVAHHVADMFDMEHHSFDTPQGRVLHIWKPQAFNAAFPPDAPLPWGRVDTWHDGLDAPRWAAPEPIPENVPEDIPEDVAITPRPLTADMRVDGVRPSPRVEPPALPSEPSTQPNDDPYAPIALERVLSQRVVQQTAELQRRTLTATQPTRIAEGTGEVYQVMLADLEWKSDLIVDS